LKLKIPTEKAIEIFEKRKQEISQYGFDPSVWKSTVENDCREIFDGVDFRWLDVGKIKFTTPVTSSKESTFAKGKVQATKLIESFIQQIREYSDIAELQSKEREKYYESEYDNLQKETSRIIAQTNELIVDQNKYLDELREQDAEIERLNKETVQLSNLSITKLFKLIGKLPLVQSIGLISACIGIIGFSLFCGTIIEKGTNQSNRLDDKTQIQKLILKEDKLNEEIIDLKATNSSQSEKLNSLNKEVIRLKTDLEKKNTAE
jgi:hypothetical protein